MQSIKNAENIQFWCSGVFYVHGTQMKYVSKLLRTFGLLAGGILLLHRIWGITGYGWLYRSRRDMFVVSVIRLFHYRKRYSCWKSI